MSTQPYLKPLLVVGGTGIQGSAVVRALRADGHPTRLLLIEAERARTADLERDGNEVVIGDLDDGASLDAAMVGVAGVYSMQLPAPPDDPEREIRHARNLIGAARRAGVETFVHSSVARAGDEEDFVGWDEGRWFTAYWTDKSAVNRLVQDAGFPHWTILKPALMMDNLLAPRSEFMYPTLRDGAIHTAVEPGTTIDWVAADDIGRFAAAALTDPARFDRSVISLAGDRLTMGEVARALTEVTGTQVVAKHSPLDELVAAGGMWGLISNQDWLNVEGYQVDPAETAEHGITPVRMGDWLIAHRDQVGVG